MTVREEPLETAMLSKAMRNGRSVGRLGLWRPAVDDCCAPVVPPLPVVPAVTCTVDAGAIDDREGGDAARDDAAAGGSLLLLLPMGAATADPTRTEAAAAAVGTSPWVASAATFVIAAWWLIDG